MLEMVFDYGILLWKNLKNDLKVVTNINVKFVLSKPTTNIDLIQWGIVINNNLLLRMKRVKEAFRAYQDTEQVSFF